MPKEIIGQLTKLGFIPEEPTNHYSFQGTHANGVFGVFLGCEACAYHVMKREAVCGQKVEEISLVEEWLDGGLDYDRCCDTAEEVFDFFSIGHDGHHTLTIDTTRKV